MTRNAKAGIIAALVLAVAAVAAIKQRTRNTASHAGPRNIPATPLPRLVDVGAGKCIPCKAMAPILEELRKDFAGRFEVEFIDVWQNPEAGKKHNVTIIPTQIFYDASGRELFRHEGFFGREDILATWKEQGFDFVGRARLAREEPLTADTRARDAVCFMCDEDIPPATRTTVRGATEQREFCSPHCYFIHFSSLVNPDEQAEDGKASVTDAASGASIRAVAASYLYGLDDKGRATIRAFANRDAAVNAQTSSAGSIVTWEVLRAKELATRCAFCDRAVYPEDASRVKAGPARLYACCEMCALGVAARLEQDIEVEVRDELTGEIITARTYDGSVAALTPQTAVAWAGQKRNAEGKMVSAGCFKQSWFANQSNLRRWLDAHPGATGRETTIAEALHEKMKLSREQIARACKLGECK